MTQTLAEKLEKEYGITCPNCGRYSKNMVHASINGNDANFCDEICILSYSRRIPYAQVTVIECNCKHDDKDYKPFFERCMKCGYIRSVK